jgi:hypothetical protein
MPVGRAYVDTLPEGYSTTSSLAPGVATTFDPTVTTGPPTLKVWVPTTIDDAPGVMEIWNPFTVAITVPSALAGIGVGRLYVDTVPDAYWTMSPWLGLRVATSLLPAKVMTEPPAVRVWLLITSVEAPA